MNMNNHWLVCPFLALLVWPSVCRSADKPANPLTGKPVAALAGLLQASPDETVRFNAAKALDELVPQKKTRPRRIPKEIPIYAPPDESVVKVLAAGLGDKASAVRHACRVALGRSGGVSIDDLIAAMADKHVEVRSCAADALGDMGTYDDADSQPLAEAVPALAEALSDTDYTVRVSAAMALSRVGVRAAQAVPRLVPLLEDDEWAVADAAVRAVAAVDPSGKRSVPALVKVLGNERHDLREFVCVELAEMGSQAEGAIPALIALLDTDRDSWQAGKAAAEALAAIVSTDPKRPELIPVSEAQRKKVVAAIAKSAAAQRYPFTQDGRLFALLPNVPSNINRHHYTGDLGPEALPALPIALKRLERWSFAPNPWVPSRGVIEFVGTVGVHAKGDVIPVVKALLANEELTHEPSRKQLEDLLEKLED